MEKPKAARLTARSPAALWPSLKVSIDASTGAAAWARMSQIRKRMTPAAPAVMSAWLLVVSELTANIDPSVLTALNLLGTVVGQAWTSTAVSVVFLALAAGSILYVVMELLNVCRLFSSKTVTAWGLLLGLTLGFATDFVLVAAGV